MLKEKRNVNIIKDLQGNDIVLINDIVFKGRRTIDWKSVKDYLKKFVGSNYNIISTNEKIFIGKDLPEEYTWSEYTKSLKGMNAKAKANAVQGIPELIEIAAGGFYRENKKEKHQKDAKYGWYKYTARFALPAYDGEEVTGFNVFHTSLIVRHSKNGKKYLYDLLDIKKETSNSLEP